MDQQNTVAVVHIIIPIGKHGPYAIAARENDPPSKEKGITFSLESPVWNEPEWPEPGTYVVLGRVIRKRAGWRAQNARYLQPDDTEGEQQ